MDKPEIRHELEVKHGTSYGWDEAAILMDVLKDNAPSCGKRVIEFERAFADYCGAEYALAVTSATTGLQLAAIAVDIQAGDEVITTPISWIATATAFSDRGARIVFCDIDERTMNLDPAKLEALITPKTKAIVPVHLFGQCCDMDAIMAIAGKHGVPVIDDCAHAPGAEWHGAKTGTLGDISVFSFQQQKNMSTLGEGGMVTTSNKVYRDRILSYRSLCCRIYGGSEKYLSIDEERFPMEKRYWHLQFDDIGFNYRITDAQAAVGLVQLAKLDEMNGRRRALGAATTERLADIPGIKTPYVDPRGKHVFHVYMIQLEKDAKVSKTDVMWELYTRYGIKAWSHYIPIHLTQPYVDRGHGPGECPVTEEVTERHITLPVHPRLTTEALDYLADALRATLLSPGIKGGPR